jgi:hypothetical protein
MTAAIIHVGDKVVIKKRREYAYPRLAEHVGKVGRVTSVRYNGDFNIHLLPETIGGRHNQRGDLITRGRNSAGLALKVGRLDVEKVKR